MFAYAAADILAEGPGVARKKMKEKHFEKKKGF